MVPVAVAPPYMRTGSPSSPCNGLRDGFSSRAHRSSRAKATLSSTRHLLARRPQGRSRRTRRVAVGGHRQQCTARRSIPGAVQGYKRSCYHKRVARVQIGSFVRVRQPPQCRRSHSRLSSRDSAGRRASCDQWGSAPRQEREQERDGAEVVERV